MSRMKATFAVVVMAAMTALVPSAFAAAKAQVVISGSSAMWTTVGLAAFNAGNCPSAKFVVKAPCFHYTDGSGKFNLTDTRPGIKQPGAPNVNDTGDAWIVWDSATTKNVWVYIKVDSVVGNRCFFAKPACNVNVPSTYGFATGGKIPSALWGGDVVPPADVQALFTAASGVLVNTAATDIRPEDALFAQCRVNSVLGNGTINGGADDGLDGLGYGTNVAGGCPAFSSTTTTTAGLVGTAIQGGVTAGSTANVVAFNISGKDPFTNSTIPATTTISVGASPIVFVFSRSTSVNAGLNGATDITDSAAQTVFSGANCDAHVIDGSIAAGTNINAYLREPLSGTFNTTEASVFRGPIKVLTKGGSAPFVTGTSQEANVGSTNPLNNTPCVSGVGARTRGIGTGDVVKGVQNSGGSNPDGIAYAFFSFGNVNPLAGSSKYGYLTLNGQDPIGIPGTVNQELPTCTAPCSETLIWGAPGTSFPALRAGNYTAWSLLRFVTTTTNSTNIQDLVNTSHTYVVSATPDYIPAQGVPIGCVGGACQDRGVEIWHTHYQQYQAQVSKTHVPIAIGLAPVNGTFNANGNPTTGDKGGDMGGCTISTSGITSTTDLGWIQLQSTPSCSGAKVR